METHNKDLERLCTEIAEYDKKYAVAQKKLQKKLWIATAIILLLVLYFGVFNTKFEVIQEKEDGCTLKVVASTAWFLQVPDTYQGKEVKSLMRTGLYNEEICPKLEFANIRPEGGLFVRNSLFIGLPYSYTLYKDYVELEQYNWVAEEITIPKRVWFKPVKSIGEFCFNPTKDYLQKVMLHDNVEIIGKYAFYDCINLAEVKGANSINEVSDYAFYSCTSLESIELGNDVKVIGDRSFMYCYALKGIEPQPNITSIGENAFLGSGLEEFEFNENADVGRSAFDSTTWLQNRPEDNVVFGDVLNVYKGERDTSIVLPAGIKTLRVLSMWDVGHSSVLLPESVTTIEENAFYYNHDVRIYIPESVTRIDGWDYEDIQNIIVTTKDSYAHQYAVEHGISYELVNNLQADWELEVLRVKTRNERDDLRADVYEQIKLRGILVDIHPIKLGMTLDELQGLWDEYDFTWESCSEGASVLATIPMTKKAVSSAMVEEVYGYPAEVTCYFDDKEALRELVIEWGVDCDEDIIFDNLAEMYGEDNVYSSLRYKDTRVDVDMWCLANGTKISFYPNWYEDGRCMLFVTNYFDAASATDAPYKEQGLDLLHGSGGNRVMLNMTKDALMRTNTEVLWREQGLSTYSGICKNISYPEFVYTIVSKEGGLYNWPTPDYYTDLIVYEEANVMYFLDENDILQEIRAEFGQCSAVGADRIKESLQEYYGEIFTMARVDIDGIEIEVSRWDLPDGISVLYYDANDAEGGIPMLFVAYTDKITFR